MGYMPYWNVPSGEGSQGMSPGKMMTVRQMGQLLGLGKTESYWLAHKGKFKVYEKDGFYLVDTESFEHWYANQTKYKKVDGTPPGEELKKRSYSIADIAGILGLSTGYVYEIIERDKIETILTDGRLRVPKEDFDLWYAMHPRYRNAEDKERDRALEESSIWLPDAARLLDISRKQLYALVYSRKNEGIFEIIEVAKRKRVTKQSFYAWYEGQDAYRLLTAEELKQKKAMELEAREQSRLARLAKKKPNAKAVKNALTYELKKPKNPRFYTMEEITSFYGFRRGTVMEWVKKGYIPVIKVGRAYRFPRGEFDDWLSMRNT